MPLKSIVGTSRNWSEEVENSKLPVLVDFWASWCGPCRMVSPIIERLAEKYDGKVKVVKVDVDDNQELASRFGIMSIPTIMLFNSGAVVASQIGSAPIEVFEEMLTTNIAV
ncbi:MAG TPA: thioredoxin [Nitrososphaerales archaeon]|nr:thioredoxin [Nitrososphaerales archaeon]